MLSGIRHIHETGDYIKLSASITDCEELELRPAVAQTENFGTRGVTYRDFRLDKDGETSNLLFE